MKTLTAEEISLLTRADVDRMSSDEYLIHLRSNPTFVARVDELEKDAKRKPR